MPSNAAYNWQSLVMRALRWLHRFTGSIPQRTDLTVHMVTSTGRVDDYCIVADRSDGEREGGGSEREREGGGE